MNKKYLALFFLAVILIIASFFRLYNLKNVPPGLYPDEAMNGNNALEAIATGEYKWFYPENNGREGLFINIQALAVKTFGNEPWVLRLAAAIFGILTVLGVYFLTKELFKNHEKKEVIALLAMFFTATGFWAILLARIGFRANMAPFFLVWDSYFAFLCFNRVRDNLPAAKWVWPAISAGLALGLGFHSYIAFRATPLVIFAVFLLYFFSLPAGRPRKNIFLAFLMIAFVALAAFAPLAFYFLKNPQDFFGRTTQVSVFAGPAPAKDLSLNILKTFAMFNFAGDYNWRHNYSGRPELFWPVGIFFLAGFFLGLRAFYLKFSPAFRKDEKYFPAFVFLFSWLAVTALPVVISNEGIPHALRAIIMIPAVFILAALGCWWIYETLLEPQLAKRPKYKVLALFVFFFFFILLAVEPFNTYFLKWAKNPNTAGAFAKNYVEIGRELNTLPKELPKCAVITGGGVLVRGVPMPSQTVMFITDTFTPEKQLAKNFSYVFDKKDCPLGSYQAVIE